jgi:hypothetical protein
MQRSVAKMLIGALFLIFLCFARRVMDAGRCRRNRGAGGVENVKFQCDDECESCRKAATVRNISRRPWNSGDCATAVIELVNCPVDCGRANAG